MVSITSGTSKISNLVIDADLNLAGYDLKTDDIKESTGAAGVTIDGVLVKDSELKTDVIHEKTGTAGVTVDGALIKDGGAASSASNFTVDGNIDMGAHDLKTDDIKESSAGHGVDIDGMVVKDNIILTIDAVGGSVIPKEVSDNLRNSHDAEINDQTGASYVKQKTMTFTNGIKGNLRIKFDLKDNPTYVGYGRVYKNGVALGAEKTGTNDWVTESEDIDVGTIAAGETLELWGKAEHASALVYLRNFRAYYDSIGGAAVAVNT